MLVQLSRRKVLRRKLDRQLDPVERPMDCGFDLVLPSQKLAQISSQPILLSADVMEKAQAIADEWGLRTAQAALEAVFRKYADEYMYGRLNTQRNQGSTEIGTTMGVSQEFQSFASSILEAIDYESQNDESQCEAMNELDGLLGL